VSGTISLPNGELAPAGGIFVEADVRSTDFDIFGSDYVLIPAGENSVTYESVTVPDSSSELQVRYRCVESSSSPNGCPGNSSYGYYAASGTVANAPEATLLPADQDHFDINMILIPAIQFSGDITLPSGMVAPAGGIELSITGVKQRTAPDDFSGDAVSTTVQIMEGLSSATYTLDVPEDVALNWTVNYNCFTNCGVLFERGFYSDSGTVFGQDQATLLTGQVDMSNIDMTLFVANVIDGTISLPSGEVAPAGGITFDLGAAGNRISDGLPLFGDFFFDLSIPEGQSTLNYSLKLQPDADTEWYVSYTCFSENCEGYTNEGFYGDPNTVPVRSEATALVGGSDASNVDLVFLPAVEVSGTVTIPDGLNISGDNLYFEVFVYDRNRPTESFFESLGRVFFGMSGPITSFEYSAAVFDDPNADLFVGVTCFDFSFGDSGPCDEFVNSTYHGDPVSEFDDQNAVILQGGQDHTDVDVLLIEADVISGVVSLPTGVAPAGGIDVNVAAFEPNAPFTFGDSFSINIPENDSSASYKLRVPSGLPANNWIVEAACTANCDNYEQYQYYAGANSAPIREQATRLPNTGPYSNIDIGLLPASMITAFTCDVLLDDFSGETLDLDNWRDPEFSGEIENGKVLIKQKLISAEERSTFGESRRFNLNLLTFPATISADVELVETDLTDSGVGSAFASVRGSFYYTLDSAADYDDNLGEVFADVEIGDRGNGLEAWYQIIESTDSNFETWITHVDEILIPAGTLQLNTTYNLSMSYNAATKEFTFSVDGTSASATGPAEGSAVVPDIGLFRGFTAGAFPEENEDSDPISIAATFDNIMANGVLVDDFSAPTLDDTIWEQPIRSRTIDQGKLRTAITSTSETTRSIFTSAQPSDYANASCFQATLGIDSTSVIPENARGRNRIDGYWYNTSFDGSSGSEYNGLEGTVYAQVVLEQIEDGSVRGALYAERVDDANYNATTQLVFHTFDTPVALDEEYVAAIQLDRDNNRLLFRFEDEVFSLPILTPIYPVNPEEDYVGFTTRIQNGIGQISATVDNVYITPLPDTVEPPAGSDEVCFPIVGSVGTAVVCF
nr:hypothetical protein [Acidiferrobacterales bacterium]